MGGKMPSKKAADGAAEPRRRLSSDERRADFIQKSIKLFAEEGFESSTRELARRLGVTQPLLYRYFPSKKDLVSAVYDEVYVRRWRPGWEDLIADRSRPLKERLIEFYGLYTDAIYHPDWIRIYLYSGLKGEEINARYMRVIRSKILGPIFAEILHSVGLPEREATNDEIDKLWVIHGGLFYFGVVKLVYKAQTTLHKSDAIAFGVTAMIDTMTKDLTIGT
jgi:AcrR family transcriptional regulator